MHCITHLVICIVVTLAGPSPTPTVKECRSTHPSTHRGTPDRSSVTSHQSSVTTTTSPAAQQHLLVTNISSRKSINRIPWRGGDDGLLVPPSLPPGVTPPLRSLRFRV